MEVHDLPTPALVIEADVLDANLATMAAAHPGTSLRPHVKAHKCSPLAAGQRALGHTALTCATPREAVGLAAAGLGDDILVTNEVVDTRRLGALAALGDDANVTVAVDSEETIDAAALAGVRSCLIDVDVGLPRCGCDPADAGRLADLARRRGLDVRGVMGYEGHLMVLDDRDRQRAEVAAAMERLRAAHADVGGDVVSAGGTGTYDLHDSTGVTEIQAGSYALMDTYYATLGLPFQQALFVVGTVISVRPTHAVADVGLKALGMDHGNPTVEGAAVWFCSDEHITFAPGGASPAVGDRIRVVPAHVDPTMAMHEVAWLVRGDTVVDRWPIDLRGWG
jgi:D-serine deaminase-like pyridoxal phosphate-dependent protein